jgi:hypothetical protein
MHAIAASDFVTKVCSHSCHYHQGLGHLSAAGHDITSTGTHGAILIGAFIALIVMIALIVRDRARKAIG